MNLETLNPAEKGKGCRDFSRRPLLSHTRLRAVQSAAMRIRCFFVVIALLSVFACNHKNDSAWSAGDLYSVANGNGTFGIVKILVVEPDAVHVRIYKQKFLTRPASVDPHSLTLGSINDKDGMGIGHLPLSRATFASWQPILLCHDTVTEEELDGYRLWKAGSGKTF